MNQKKETKPLVNPQNLKAVGRGLIEKVKLVNDRPPNFTAQPDLHINVPRQTLLIFIQTSTDQLPTRQ